MVATPPALVTVMAGSRATNVSVLVLAAVSLRAFLTVTARLNGLTEGPGALKVIELVPAPLRTVRFPLGADQVYCA